MPLQRLSRSDGRPPFLSFPTHDELTANTGPKRVQSVARGWTGGSGRAALRFSARGPGGPVDPPKGGSSAGAKGPADRPRWNKLLRRSEAGPVPDRLPFRLDYSGTARAEVPLDPTADSTLSRGDLRADSCRGSQC